jgi:hypothetical protein
MLDLCATHRSRTYSDNARSIIIIIIIIIIMRITKAANAHSEYEILVVFHDKNSWAIAPNCCVTACPVATYGAAD